MKAILSIVIYCISVFKLRMSTGDEINRMCWNFLWDGPDATTFHALVGYDDMCYPFEEVGWGIRDIETENRAIILRHLWYSITKKNTL